MEYTPYSAQEVQDIFFSACAGCHTGGNATGGLNLDTFEETTINAPSSAAMPLITPGDHLNSYLWNKLNGTHLDVGGNGIRMPSGAPLSDTEIGRIGAYIDNIGF